MLQNSNNSAENISYISFVQ